jgi:hypothetical protein
MTSIDHHSLFKLLYDSIISSIVSISVPIKNGRSPFILGRGILYLASVNQKELPKQ